MDINVSKIIIMYQVVSISSDIWLAQIHNGFDAQTILDTLSQ